MRLIKPDIGMDPTKPRWVPATTDDFTWKDTIGTHMEHIQAQVHFPNGNGYFSINACHLRRETVTHVFRYLAFHSTDPTIPDFFSQKMFPASQFKVLDPSRLSVNIADVRMTCTNIHDGYIMECGNNDASFSLMFSPEVVPLRIGSGRCFTPTAQYQHTAHLIRCKVTGWLVIEGKPIEMDGAIGNVERLYRNILMRDMPCWTRAIHAHGPRITIVSTEAQLHENLGGGWLSETYAVLDGHIVDAQTGSTSTGVDLLRKSLPYKNAWYRTYHPLTLGRTHLIINTEDPTVEMVRSFDMFEWLSRMFGHRMQTPEVKPPVVVWHFAKVVPTVVNGVMDVTSAMMVQRIVPSGDGNGNGNGNGIS